MRRAVYREVGGKNRRRRSSSSKAKSRTTASANVGAGFGRMLSRLLSASLMLESSRRR